MSELRFGRTALHAAAAAGDQALVSKYIERGVDIEARDDFGDSALLAAVGADKVAAARVLLEAGAVIEYRFQRESTPAAREKQESEIRQLFKRAKDEGHREVFDDLYETDEERKAAFEEMVRDQVELAFEAETKSAVNDCSSLEMAKLLFGEFKADLNHISPDGYWPLKNFAELADEAAIAWLLKQGAKVDQTSTGDTALHAAVREDSIACATLLLDAGADPNAQDVDGWNPLFYVEGEAMLDLLVARGAKVAMDQAGFLPTDFADDDAPKAKLKALEREAGFEESPGAKLRKQWQREEAEGGE